MMGGSFFLHIFQSISSFYLCLLSLNFKQLLMSGRLHVVKFKGFVARSNPVAKI